MEVKEEENRTYITNHITNHLWKGNVLTYKGSSPAPGSFEALYTPFLGQVRHLTDLEITQLLSHQRVTLQKHKLEGKWPCFP